MKEVNNPATYLLAMIRDLMKFWYLIAISLFITCGFAAVFLKFSAKKHKIAATIVLNIEELDEQAENYQQKKFYKNTILESSHKNALSLKLNF